jgi:hypothetical protein
MLALPKDEKGKEIPTPEKGEPPRVAVLTLGRYSPCQNQNSRRLFLVLIEKKTVLPYIFHCLKIEF